MRNLKKHVPKKIAGEEYDSIVFSNMFSHFDLGVKLLLLFLTFDELLVLLPPKDGIYCDVTDQKIKQVVKCKSAKATYTVH